MFVGLFVFFGLAIMGVLILQFGQFENKLEEHYPLIVDFPDATGIRKGVPVRLGGADLGFVAEDPILKDDYSGLRLVLHIKSHRKIPKGSRFSIATAGLMGDTFVKISLPEEIPNEVYAANAELEGGSGSGLEALQGSAEDLIDRIAGTMSEISTTVESLDRLFKKIEQGVLADENVENIKLMLAELKESSANIKATTKKLEPVVDDAGDAMKSAKGAMAKMDETFASAKGTFASANETFEKANSALETIETTVAKAGPAMDNLDPTLEELRSVLVNANRTISKIESGDGVAAALISDSGLKEDLESFVEKLDKNGVLFYPREKKRKGLFSGNSNSASVPQEKPRAVPVESLPQNPGSIAVPRQQKFFPFSRLKKDQEKETNFK